jgi:hypothetical protein
MMVLSVVLSVEAFLGMKRVAVDPDWLAKDNLGEKTSPKPGVRKQAPCKRHAEREGKCCKSNSVREFD